MQQIFPVEEHREQPDYERPCNVNQKRCERELPIIMFIDSERGEITSQGANPAARQDKKVSSEQ